MMYTVKISFKVITKIPLMKKTTVTIDEETKNRLANFGKKGESFDEILTRVMKNTSALCSTQKNGEDAELEK